MVGTSRRLAAVVAAVLVVVAVPVAISDLSGFSDDTDPSPIGEVSATHTGNNSTYVYALDGQKIKRYNADDGTLDWESPTLGTEAPTERAVQIQFGPDGDRLYAGLAQDNGYAAAVWTANGSVIWEKSLASHSLEVVGTEVTSDGQYAFFGGEGGTVSKVYAVNGTEVDNASKGSDLIMDIQLDPSEENIYVSDQTSTMGVFSASDLTSQRTVTDSELANWLDVEFNDDGTIYYHAGPDTSVGGRVKARYVANDSVKWNTEAGLASPLEYPHEIDFNHDKTYIYTITGGAGSDYGDLYKIYRSNGTVVYSVTGVFIGRTVAVGVGDRIFGGGGGGGSESDFSAFFHDDGSLLWENSSTASIVGLNVYGNTSTGGSSGGGSGGSSTTDEDLYLQTFELFVHDSGFNPQTSHIELRYRVDEDDVRVEGGYLEAGSWVLQETGEFGFDNQTTVRIFNGTTYKITVVDLGSDDRVEGNKYWVRTGYVADEDEGLVELHIKGEGPGPGDGGGGGDWGGFTPSGPGDDWRLDLPDVNDTSLEPLLQTGVFNFLDEGQCVGLRYFDPTGQTTEIDYSFTFDGQTYSDTVELDEPVGYYEECIEPIAAGSGSLDAPDLPSGDVQVDFVWDDTAYNGSLDFGEGGSSFTFDSVGGAAGPVQGESGILPNIPWWWWLLLLILAYIFRDEIKKFFDDLTNNLGF